MSRTDPDKERRLAEALRANLRKRKERDRAPEGRPPLADAGEDTR